MFTMKNVSRADLENFPRKTISFSFTKSFAKRIVYL